MSISQLRLASGQRFTLTHEGNVVVGTPESKTRPKIGGIVVMQRHELPKIVDWLTGVCDSDA